MASNYIYIADLEKEKDDQTIRARVTRKWESKNIKTNNTLIYIDVILLDEHVSNLDNVICKTFFLLFTCSNIYVYIYIFIYRETIFMHAYGVSGSKNSIIYFKKEIYMKCEILMLSTTRRNTRLQRTSS